MNAIRNLSFSLLLAGPLVLGGCAGNLYSKANKADIHTVQLTAKVESEHEMRYGVDASQPDDLRSVVSTEMMNDVGQDGLRRMKLVMKKKNIVVTQMIHDAVEKKLQEQSNLVLKTEPPTDGVVAVKVLQYGFNDMPFSLMHETPFLVLQMTLSDKDGHVVWTRKSKWKLPSEDEAGASWDEYETHPDELRDEWNTQIHQALERLMPD